MSMIGQVIIKLEIFGELNERDREIKEGKFFIKN